jgi:hypothetical protein
MYSAMYILHTKQRYLTSWWTILQFKQTVQSIQLVKGTPNYKALCYICYAVCYYNVFLLTNLLQIQYMLKAENLCIYVQRITLESRAAL